MIVGRAPECARLEALLAGARAGRSGALVLEGEPGIGKTALLEHTAAFAEDFTVLHAVGVQSEARLAFSGLLQLLRPVLGELAAVPEPQAEALRRALGLTERSSLDLYLAFAGALYLLAAASETRPVLCLVDDAHWLDAASAEGVGFVARRIEAERIAMLVAIRPGEGRAADVQGLECVSVGGLGADAARVVLGSAGVALAAGVADQLIEATGANPLALLEVPLVLSEDQRAGGEPLEHPVAIGERVERAFLARAAGLSPAARRTLLVAAASEDGDLGVIAAVVGEAFAAIDEAEAAGLVRVRGTELAFRHPLVRSAIYTAAVQVSGAPLTRHWPGHCETTRRTGTCGISRKLPWAPTRRSLRHSTPQPGAPRHAVSPTSSGCTSGRLGSRATRRGVRPGSCTPGAPPTAAGAAMERSGCSKTGSSWPRTRCCALTSSTLGSTRPAPMGTWARRLKWC